MNERNVVTQRSASWQEVCLLKHRLSIPHSLVLHESGIPNCESLKFEFTTIGLITKCSWLLFTDLCFVHYVSFRKSLTTWKVSTSSTVKSQTSMTTGRACSNSYPNSPTWMAMTWKIRKPQTRMERLMVMELTTMMMRVSSTYFRSPFNI